MDEKIKKLWNGNKILFWILFPFILLLFIGYLLRDLIIAALIGSARKTTEDARSRDKTLEEKMHAEEVEATKSKAEADAAAKRIEERKESDIDLDWNKKGN